MTQEVSKNTLFRRPNSFSLPYVELSVADIHVLPGLYDQVVQKNKHFLLIQITHALFHEALECAGSIHDTLQYPVELPEPEGCHKGSLGFVCFIHFDLIVAGF